MFSWVSLGPLGLLLGRPWFILVEGLEKRSEKTTKVIKKGAFGEAVDMPHVQYIVVQIYFFVFSSRLPFCFTFGYCLSPFWSHFGSQVRHYTPFGRPGGQNRLTKHRQKNRGTIVTFEVPFWCPKWWILGEMPAEAQAGETRIVHFGPLARKVLLTYCSCS